MQQDTMDVLKHVAVHGTRTRAEVAKAFPHMPGAGKAVDNLAMLGYLVDNGMTTPKTFILSRKAKEKLAQPFKPAKLRTAREKADEALQMHVRQYVRPVRPASVPHPRSTAWHPKPWHYRPTEFEPSSRAGAMNAFELPSRFGDRLRWPDGRITDLDGNPTA